MTRVRLNEYKIEDIVVAVLDRAKNLFPKCKAIHGTLASQDGMIVYRIAHESLAFEKEDWVVIVKLTRIWDSDNRPSFMAPEDMKRVVEEYDEIVDQAEALGIVKLDDFTVAK